MKFARLFLPLVVLVVAIPTFGDDKTDEKPAAAAPAAPAAPINVGDGDALKANTDKEATVEGTVSRANWSPSGSIFFINFDEAKTTKFSTVFFKDAKDAMEKAFDGDVAKALKGAKVQITGKIIDYKGKPEIKLDKPEQIKIITKAADASDDKKDGDDKKDAGDKKDEPKKE